ncbi:restriction endonuclease subunit S [Campylobacter concisus]|uniref:restriction endonuclease subunit S n=1 Tax=Campylobacter concisus TaxID=199 RepID=UPI000CD8544C|nr:restriction endonuclease subunit S [Campylobacter concisus]
MSKIFDLINELCPDGVEFKELGEIADIVRGQRVTKAELQNDGKYPVVSGGIKPLGFLNKFNREANTITVAQYGTAGYINFIEEKFWANDVCYCIFPKKEISNKFLLYCLMKNQEFIYSLRTNAIPAHLPQKLLSEIKLPVPPMEVQREIVRILDSFTLLTAELTAELTARKKQYEFYRDFLLSFDELDKNGGCELKTLGEICELIRGNGLQKKDFVERGVPAIHYGQIYTYYGTFASKTKSFVSVDTARNLKKVNFGDVVITNTSENLQDVGKAVVYLGKEQAVTGGHATILKPKNTFLGKFFVYLSQTAYFYNEKVKYAKGTKVIDVSASDMSKILIPVPSLQTQQKVVEILDKFDTLVNSITDGLPREIELRRKQYEYYREKLLNFTELKKEI